MASRMRAMSFSLVAHEIASDGLQPRLGGEQVYLLGKFRLQLVPLVYVQIYLLNGVQYLRCDLRVVQVQDLLAAVLIIKRHRGAVLNSSLKS